MSRLAKGRFFSRTHFPFPRVASQRASEPATQRPSVPPAHGPRPSAIWRLRRPLFRVWTLAQVAPSNKRPRAADQPSLPDVDPALAMDSLSEGDDDPEPEVFADPLAIAAARQAQLLKSQVKEVQALIHVLVMAAQGHGGVRLR